MSVSRGCGHPACCQTLFGDKHLHKEKQSARDTFFASLLVFIVPVCLFVATIVLATFSPVVVLLLAFAGCALWFGALWLYMRSRCLLSADRGYAQYLT